MAPLPLTQDQSLAREVLLRTFPAANALDDDTLDAIVRQEQVELPSRESSAAIDFFEIANYVKDYLPIATGLLTIIKISFDLSSPKAPSKLPTADELADAVINKLANENKIDRQLVLKTAQNALAVSNKKRES